MKPEKAAEQWVKANPGKVNAWLGEVKSGVAAVEERTAATPPGLPSMLSAALRADPEAGNLRFPVTPPFGRDHPNRAGLA